MADDAIISYSDLIGKDGTFDDISKEIAQIEKELIDMAKTTEKAFAKVKPSDSAEIERLEKEVKKYTVALKNLGKIEEANNKGKKKNIELTQEELVQREALKLEKREALRLAKAQAIILKEEKDTIASLRAQLSKATIEWTKFTAEELRNTKEGKKALEDKKRLTAQLKKLEKATGDNRREVGNYSNALKGLRKGLIRVFVGRTVIDGVLRLGGAFKDLVDDFRDSNEVIGGIGQAFDKVTGSLQFAGVKILEFLAPAIEFVADLISKLPAFFAGIGAASSQLAANLGATFNKIGLNIELVFAKIERNNPFSSRNAQQIEANIRRIENAIAAQTARQGNLSDAYKQAYDAVLVEQDAFIQAQEEKDKAAAAKKAREERLRIQAEEQRKLEIRLSAIIKLQKELDKLQAENIKDGQDRAFALENLRFQNELALRKSQFDKLQEFFKDNEEKLAELSQLRRDTDAESEQQHQERLLKIRKQFAIKFQDVEALTQESINEQRQKEIDDFNEKYGIDTDQLKQNQADITAEFNKGLQDRQDAQKKSTDELLKGISQTAEKVSAEITKVFEKQADLAAESVDRQQENLTRARDRAERGLEANIAFEEAELAKREAEQQRRDKEAKQAASLLALFNLVAAYAGNGDENALFRGFADWSALTALANLPGFYEGTEMVADDLGANKFSNGRDGYLVRVDGTERIMKGIQNAALHGMSNDELVANALIGESIGDYYNPQSLSTQSLFNEQKATFEASMKGSSSTSDVSNIVVRELQSLRKQLANQPNVGIEIEKVYKNVYDIIKTEIKTHMKKVSKSRL